MSEWRSVAKLSASEQARIVQLLPFGDGVIQFRAKTAVIVDYEPCAYAEKNLALQRERQRQEVEDEARTSRGEDWVRPLGSPVIPGRKPWLDDVPMTQSIVDEYPIPSDEISGLGIEIWESASDTQTDDEDRRRKRLLIGIEYRILIPAISMQAQSGAHDKFTAEGAGALGLGGKYFSSDFPLILEMHKLVVQGESIRAAAKKFAASAEGVNTDIDSRVDRLRQLYSRWERLGA